MINFKEEVDIFLKMEIFIREIFQKGNFMEKENYKQKNTNILDLGQILKCMATEFKSLRILLNILDISILEKRMEMVFINFKMEIHIKGNLKIILLEVMVSINGLMGMNMKDNGNKIKCGEREYLNGQMEIGFKVIIKINKRLDLVKCILLKIKVLIK